MTVTSITPIDVSTADLHAANMKRLESLNQRGQRLMGIDEHYLVELVELLLGPERVAQAKYTQEVWLSAELDRIESMIRQGALLAPLNESFVGPPSQGA